MPALPSAYDDACRHKQLSKMVGCHLPWEWMTKHLHLNLSTSACYYSLAHFEMMPTGHSCNDFLDHRAPAQKWNFLFWCNFSYKISVQCGFCADIVFFKNKLKDTFFSKCNYYEFRRENEATTSRLWNEFDLFKRLFLWRSSFNNLAQFIHFKL